MRVLQAIGYVLLSLLMEFTYQDKRYRSSSVFSMGAATLSDIYDSHVRGTMMGILYSYVCYLSVIAWIPTFTIPQCAVARTSSWSYDWRSSNASFQLACNVLVYCSFPGCVPFCVLIHEGHLQTGKESDISDRSQATTEITSSGLQTLCISGKHR